MEYLIMKLYEQQKNEKKLKLGLNRFSKKQKIIAIVLLVVMVLTTFASFILMFAYQNSPYYLIMLSISILSMIVLLIIDNYDRKIKINVHIDEYKKKITLLNNIIKNEFSIDSEEKIDELILMYQKYIDKQNESDKKKNKIITTVFTVLGGILSTSFLNIEKTGLDFIRWLEIALLLTFIVCCSSIYLYSMKYFNFTKNKYENIINDLESIKLFEY